MYYILNHQARGVLVEHVILIFSQNMEILEFFNTQNPKYTNLLPNVLLSEELFNNEAEKDNIAEKNILTAINTRLEQAATFSQGLCLLDNFVSKISQENLIKYFPHWISKLTQKLNYTYNDSQQLTAVCKTFVTLITSCKKVPELDKRISLYHVKQILGIITEQYNQKKHLSWLNLLAVFLYHYPESCVRLQASFNNIISSCIDDEDKYFVNIGAKCYSLLIRANERSFIRSYKDNYVILPDNSSASCHIYYQINLCHYLHGIMDELFQNFVTATSELPLEFQKAKNNNILDLPEISQEDLFEYYAANVNRFVNICTFLSTLLKVGNSGKRFVLPNVILHVVCRGLSITSTNLQKSDESKREILLLILPKLYTGLMNVLEATITSFQQELVPFAFNIQKLVLQTLEWTQKCHSEPLKNIRILTYKLLSAWMKQAQSLSGVQLIADELLLHILKDMSQANDKVYMLKATKNSTKKNSKVEKSVETLNLKNNDSIYSNVTRYTDSILRLQVLSTVESIVSNANYALKQSFYNKIRNTVVLLLYEQYTKKALAPSDQTSVRHRLQLLKTLRALETYAQASSSTSHAIRVFGLAASQEHNSEIVEEARLGLAELRPVVYPTAPTLMLPLSEPVSPEPTLAQALQFTVIPTARPVRRISQTESDDAVESSKRPRLDQENVRSNGLDLIKESKEIEMSQGNGNVADDEKNKSNGDVEDEKNKSNGDVEDEKNKNTGDSADEKNKNNGDSADEKNKTNGDVQNENNEIKEDSIEEEMILTFCDEQSDK